jgi:hypothetical protein
MKKKLTRLRLINAIQIVRLSRLTWMEDGIQEWRLKKQSRYRPEQAQRVDRGIALPFRDLGARMGCVVSRFTSAKDPAPIVQEAGWASGPVWTCAKNLTPTGIRSPDGPARSQSLYRLNYPGPSGMKITVRFGRRYNRHIQGQGLGSIWRDLP